MLAVILGDVYPIIEVADGEQAIAQIREHGDEIAAILLDLIMPKLDGYAVLSYMKEKELMDRIPVLIISAESSSEAERRCMEMGVSDFIRKPFDSITVRKRVRNMADLFMYKNNLEDKVKAQTQALKRQKKILEQQTIRLKENNEKIIDTLGTVVKYRNLESGEHIKRVKGFTKILAEKVAAAYPEYGLAGEEIPISAQLVSVADVYDALVSERVYKDAYDKDKAYHMILMGECGVFSPKLMECFRNSKAEFEALAAKNGQIK